MLQSLNVIYISELCVHTVYTSNRPVDLKILSTPLTVYFNIRNLKQQKASCPTNHNNNTRS